MGLLDFFRRRMQGRSEPTLSSQPSQVGRTPGEERAGEREQERLDPSVGRVDAEAVDPDAGIAGGNALVEGGRGGEEFWQAARMVAREPAGSLLALLRLSSRSSKGLSGRPLI